MFLSRVLCRLVKEKRKYIFDCEKTFENQRHSQFQTAFALRRITSYSVLERRRESGCSLSRLLVVLAPQIQADPRTPINCLLVRQLMNKELSKNSEVKNYQERFDIIQIGRQIVHVYILAMVLLNH